MQLSPKTALMAKYWKHEVRFVCISGSDIHFEGNGFTLLYDAGGLKADELYFCATQTLAELILGENIDWDDYVEEYDIEDDEFECSVFDINEK